MYEHNSGMGYVYLFFYELIYDISLYFQSMISSLQMLHFVRLFVSSPLSLSLHPLSVSLNVKSNERTKKEKKSNFNSFHFAIDRNSSRKKMY